MEAKSIINGSFYLFISQIFNKIFCLVWCKIREYTINSKFRDRKTICAHEKVIVSWFYVFVTLCKKHQLNCINNCCFARIIFTDKGIKALMECDDKARGIIYTIKFTEIEELQF